MSNDKEQQFVKHVRDRLDHSVDELDTVTLARLKAARLTALESRDRQPIWQNKLVLASAMSVTLVAGIWLIQKPVTQDLPMDDLQILTASEDMELYRDLEFYQWLEYQREQS